MNRVFLTIINGTLGSMTNATIEDPVDPKIRVENALKYFGIREIDVEWSKSVQTIVPNEKLPLTTKVGNIEGTSKVIIISYY